MSIEIIAQSKSGKTVMFGTQEGRVINECEDDPEDDGFDPDYFEVSDEK